MRLLQTVVMILVIKLSKHLVTCLFEAVFQINQSFSVVMRIIELSFSLIYTLIVSSLVHVCLSFEFRCNTRASYASFALFFLLS